MRVYWMTWDEKKNGGLYHYFRMVMAETVADAYGCIYRNEQNERYIQGKPHMFHVKITRRMPYDLDIREKGHLYY